MSWFKHHSTNPSSAAVADHISSCPHVALVPRWDRLEDMGHEGRVSWLQCQACGARLTAIEAAKRLTEADCLHAALELAGRRN